MTTEPTNLTNQVLAYINKGALSKFLTGRNSSMSVNKAAAINSTHRVAINIIPEEIDGKATLTKEEVRDLRKSVQPMTFQYTNYRGKTEDRSVLPIRFYHGRTQHHSDEQYLLRAYCLSREEVRDFAFKDMMPRTNYKYVSMEKDTITKALKYLSRLSLVVHTLGENILNPYSHALSHLSAKGLASLREKMAGEIDEVNKFRNAVAVANREYGTIRVYLDNLCKENDSVTFDALVCLINKSCKVLEREAPAGTLIGNNIFRSVKTIQQACKGANGSKERLFHLLDSEIDGMVTAAANSARAAKAYEVD